jgi:hypothetical protein
MQRFTYPPRKAEKIMFTNLKWYCEAFVILAIAAGGLYGWHKVADGYREQGRVEVRGEWDGQKLVDAEAKTKEIEDVIKAERADAAVKARIDKKLLEDIKHENIELNNRLAFYRGDNRKLRTITGEAIRESQDGKNGTKSSVSFSNSTCTVRLPPEIGEGFKRLRETIIRIGSEANNTGFQANAASEVIAQDRATCNGGLPK